MAITLHFVLRSLDSIPLLAGSLCGQFLDKTLAVPMPSFTLVCNQLLAVSQNKSSGSHPPAPSLLEVINALKRNWSLNIEELVLNSSSLQK